MIINEMERNYLVDEMESLLTEYDYEYSRHALETIVDTWAERKATLINAFKKHPKYVEGKFMIAYDINFERGIDIAESYAFSRWLRDNAFAHKELLPKEMLDRMEPDNYLPQPIYDFFYWLHNYAERCISESTANYLNLCVPEIHAHAGQKTSRVVNKLCTYLGYDKVDGYNRAFARYADSLSPISIKRHTVLSINPLDFLTMSFGNSWSSCHTIDKNNRRGMPNGYHGQYSSGTISYMLDVPTMILYTVDGAYNGNDYWTQPKVNRQIFHWGEDKLIQSRLYPQDNDSDSEAYTPYRNVVQEIMSTIFDFPNLWTISRGGDQASKFIINGGGTNYADYRYFSNVTLCRIKGIENSKQITVGASPICIECGCTHHVEESINCCPDSYVCADCGERLDEDDVCWINGEAYCSDCVSWCDWCDSYHRTDSYFIEDRHIYVCEHCYEEDFYYCDECGDNVRDAYWVESESIYVCQYCRDRHFTECHECRELVRDDDVVWINEDPHCESCAEEHNEAEEVC